MPGPAKGLSYVFLTFTQALGLELCSQGVLPAGSPLGPQDPHPRMSYSHPWRCSQHLSLVIFTNKPFCGIVTVTVWPWQHDHELQVPFFSKYPGLDDKLPGVPVIRLLRQDPFIHVTHMWVAPIWRHSTPHKKRKSHCETGLLNGLPPWVTSYLSWFPQA